MCSSDLFSEVAVSLYIPTKSAKGFIFFPTPSSSLIICRFLDDGQSRKNVTDEPSSRAGIQMQK